MKIAGCWVHAKRKFSDIVKAKTDFDLIASEAVRRISEISHLDNTLKDLNSKERQKQRMIVVKPKVDDLFAWAKSRIETLTPQSESRKGLQYCINQEQFLRVFLSDGDIPMNNNPAEQAISPFTLGRKNWVNMDTVRGAEASAIMYSLVETAKANHLRIYDYLELLLTELPKHADDTSRDFMIHLLPWSEFVQEKCRAGKRSN